MKISLLLCFLFFATLNLKGQNQFSKKPYSIEFGAIYSFYTSGIGVGQSEINQFLYSEKMNNGHGFGLSFLYSYYFKKMVISAGLDLSQTTFSNSELSMITFHPEYGFILTSVQRTHTSLLYAIPKIQIGLNQVIKSRNKRTKYLLRETIGIVFPLNAHHSKRYKNINNNEQSNDSEWFSGDDNWILGLGYNAGFNISRNTKQNNVIKGYGVGFNLNYFPHTMSRSHEFMAMTSLNIML